MPSSRVGSMQNELLYTRTNLIQLRENLLLLVQVPSATLLYWYMLGLSSIPTTWMSSIDTWPERQNILRILAVKQARPGYFISILNSQSFLREFSLALARHHLHSIGRVNTKK